jgi:2-methylisocitrate lyase-like PEP mutase family enzyme
MRTATEKRKLLRDLLAGPEMLVAPSVGMPIGARLVEHAGFPAIHGAGSVAHQISCYADAGLLTMTEMVGRMVALSDAVDIPVIADMDTGFGDPPNVIRTVREYERGGVAAFHIEDTASKAPFSEGHAPPVISRREMVNKIRAAVDTRTDESMVIIARSEVRGDLDEFIARLGECVEAGADACWISGAIGEEGVQALKKAVTRPFVGVLPRGLTADQFHAWGANLAVIPGAMELAALHAQRQLLDELKRNGSIDGYFKRQEGIDDTRGFAGRQGRAEYEAIMERFGGV